MRIAITGATGFVGQHLCPALIEAGHEVIALVRAKPGRDLGATGARLGGAEARAYDGFNLASTRAAIEGADGVVNLAGENILGGRWTEAFLAACRRSRVETTAVLIEAMAGLDVSPRVLVSASAIGWYGAREATEAVTEASDVGDDPLAEICTAWEAAALPAADAGTRVVRLRLGMVIGKGGGALAKMETPFKFGVGGRLGGGHQMMSWIHIDDVVGLILYALANETLSGPVNATAPTPVSNREFTKAFAKRLRRPAFLPVPGFALRLMLGAGAQVLLTGQRVLPAAAQAAGYAFQHPALEGALADLYPRD